jgi:hypothetical protein
VNTMVCSSSPPMVTSGSVQLETKPVPVRVAPLVPSVGVGKVIVIVSSAPSGVSGESLREKTAVIETLPASTKSPTIFLPNPVSERHDDSISSMLHSGSVNERTHAIAPEVVSDTVVPCPVVPAMFENPKFYGS